MLVKHANLGSINKNSVTLYNEANGTDVELYFSYDTIIGFSIKGFKQVIDHFYSNTTAKFQNEIDPEKTQRLEEQEFDQKLSEALASII